MHADRLRDERHYAHDYENEREHRIFALEVVVRPTDHIKHESPPDGKTHEKEYGSADEAFGGASKVDTAGLREAQRDCDDDPADRVLEYGGGYDQLTEIAAREIHLAHDRG